MAPLAQDIFEDGIDALSHGSCRSATGRGRLRGWREQRPKFSNQEYSNDLMLDRMTYGEFLSRCDSDKSFCIGEINFITCMYREGRFACAYAPKDLETVSMGVVTLMKFALDKNPAYASHTGNTLRGDVTGAIDFLGKTCAERLKNAGG